MNSLLSIISGVNQIQFGYHSLTSEEANFITLLFFLFGGLFCFLGYHFFRFVFGLFGFVFGGLIILAIFDYLPVVNRMGSLGRFVLIAVAGTVCASLFYLFLVGVGFFLFGSITAMWVASLVLSGLPQDIWNIAILAIGFTGGFLAVTFKTQMMIISTSALGSTAIVAALGQINKWPLSVNSILTGAVFQENYFVSALENPDSGSTISFLLVLFFLLGLLVQHSKILKMLFNKAREKGLFARREPAAEKAGRGIAPKVTEPTPDLQAASRPRRRAAGIFGGVMQNLGKIIAGEDIPVSPKSPSANWSSVEEEIDIDTGAKIDFDEDEIWGGTGKSADDDKDIW